jgi:hypothetical protein
MKRRNFAIGFLGMSGAAAAQNNLNIEGLKGKDILKANDAATATTYTIERDPTEYEICKRRGHVEDVDFNRFQATDALYRSYVPERSETPGYSSTGQWKRCYYCHTMYRLVTKLEEK